VTHLSIDGQYPERQNQPVRALDFAPKKATASFRTASDRFWQLLSGDQSFRSWYELRETILDLLPDMDDDGSLEAQFALNAGLVAADIAGLAEDGQDSHVVEPLTYALESIYAKVSNEMRVSINARANDETIMKHLLMQKERQREHDDVEFVGALPKAPWSEGAVIMLRERVQVQESLLGKMRWIPIADKIHLSGRRNA
jgi:hypothetical protein